MEAIAELFVAIAAFVIEITFHSLVFLFLLCRSAVSPKYREQMRSEWGKSLGHRFAIVTGLLLYTAMFVVAATIWVPAIFARGGSRTPPLGIESPASSGSDAPPSNEHKAVRAIGDYLKKKLQERSGRAIQSPESSSTR
jgi:hypothetical protein